MLCTLYNKADVSNNYGNNHSKEFLSQLEHFIPDVQLYTGTHAL